MPVLVESFTVHWQESVFIDVSGWRDSTKDSRVRRVAPANWREVAVYADLAKSKNARVHYPVSGRDRFNGDGGDAVELRESASAPWW